MDTADQPRPDRPGFYFGRIIESIYSAVSIVIHSANHRYRLFLRDDLCKNIENKIEVRRHGPFVGATS